MACTQFASTNSTDLSYIAEADCGVTPATPAFQLLPTTGGGPTGNITTTTSEVIRSDRMTDDLIVTDSEISGTANYELSYAPYKPIMQSLLMDTAPVTVASTANTISIVATTGVATGTTTTFITDGMKAGMFLKISSATDDTQDGVYKILSVTSETEFAIAADAMSGDLSETDIAINGVIHRNGIASADNYTFCKRVINGGTTSYFYYRGCQVSQMTFNFETGSILNGTFDVMGLTEEATTTEIATSSYLPVPAYTLMNSVSSVTGINLGGASATTEFSSMGITVNNNITAAKAIGTLGAAALAPFTLEISSESTLYFEDTTIYNQYLNATALYVDIELVDGDGNVLVISMPKAKFSALDAPVDSKDNFMFQNGTLTALRDATEDYMIQFSFIDAV